MKINDVLECINTVIEARRIIKNINVKGHFIATTEVKKSMGPYKQVYINIVYIDTTNNKNFTFVTGSHMDRVLIENIDSFKEVAEKQALVKFFTIIHEDNIWNNILEGKYGIE